MTQKLRTPQTRKAAQDQGWDPMQRILQKQLERRMLVPMPRKDPRKLETATPRTALRRTEHI